MGTEMGGKDLIVKAGIANTYTTDATTAAITFATAHGLAVGDLWSPVAVGASVAIAAGRVYYVKTITSATVIQVSKAPSTAAIIPGVIITAQACFAYTNIGGIRSKSFAVSATEIDITNEDSSQWKTLLDAAGIRAVAFSGSGVYSQGANVKALRTAFLANTIVPLALLEVAASYVWAGSFKITSLEISGDYSAESSLAIAGSSSGAVSLSDMTA